MTTVAVTYFVRDSQSFLFSKQNLLPRLSGEEINAKLIFASQYNSPANLILMQSATWNPQKLRPQYSKLYTGSKENNAKLISPTIQSIPELGFAMKCYLITR